jgi:hypothetical protein
MKEPWFATFTFLDVGGAISSTQLQRFSGAMTALWRRILGRPV